MAIELAKAYVQIVPTTQGIQGSLENALNDPAKKAGEESGNKLTDGLKSAMKTAGKVTAAALAAGTVAAGKLAADAVSSYAEYEQLAGGVEKLYGTASDKLMGFADAAYATAGMSANAYMETATSFSAALIGSLEGDVDKAADMTDVAMKAISDNVNVFGSDMESVKYAFQGFAKQNYTMLDNLKLGYGGTKEEMQRLIDDANTYRESIGESADLSIDSFADVVLAVQSVQEAQGIAGTTAKEAMHTIEGAATATKSAWSNVITAIGRGEGMEDAMSGLVTSIFGGEDGGGLMEQIIPRIQTVVEGIGVFVTQAAPVIAEQFPVILEALLPPLLVAASDLIKSVLPAIMGALPVIVEALVAALPDIITMLATVLVENLPILINGIIQIVGAIIENLPTILQALWDAIVLMWDSWVAPMMEGVGQFFTDLWESVKEIFAGVAQWFDETVIQPVMEFFTGLWDAISTAASAAWEWIAGVWGTVRDWFDANIITPLREFFSGLWQAIVNAWNTVIGPWIEIAKRLWLKIKEGASQAWEGIKNIWKTVSGWFNQNIVTPVKNFFTKLWTGLKTGASTAWNGIKSIWTTVSNWFNTKIITPVKNFFTNMWNGLKTGATNAWNGIKNIFTPVINWFKDTFSKAWEGVKNVFSTGGRIFSGIKEGLENVFKTVVNAIIRGINTVVAIPFNAINGFLNTLRNINILGVAPFSWIGSIGVPQIPLLAKGGVLTSPTLMIGGEAGAEAVVPLERNTDWIRSVAVEMDEVSGDDTVLLEAILEKMDRMAIYLDSGKLVGGISGRMDGALGSNAGIRKRGVALT